jgi:hypothetical protein
MNRNATHAKEFIVKTEQEVKDAKHNMYIAESFRDSIDDALSLALNHEGLISQSEIWSLRAIANKAQCSFEYAWGEWGKAKDEFENSPESKR